MDLVPSPSLHALADVVTLLRARLFGWAGRGVLTMALMGLVHNRLGVVGLRLERMMARFRAGRPVVSARSVVTASRVLPVGWVRPVNYWPRQPNWLRVALGPVMQHHVSVVSGTLERILREPDWVALLGAAPEAGRMLRPICRMLGMDLALLDPLAAAPVRHVPRVRAARPAVEPYRIPLPRGTLAAARRDRALEQARAKIGRPPR